MLQNLLQLKTNVQDNFPQLFNVASFLAQCLFIILAQKTAFIQAQNPLFLKSYEFSRGNMSELALFFSAPAPPV